MLRVRIARNGGHAIKLLTNLTPIDTLDACMSAGGLIDRETACGRDVALWSDPETVASIERAVAMDSDRGLGSHAA